MLRNTKIETALDELRKIGKGEIADVAEAELQDMIMHIHDVSTLIHACFPMDKTYVDDKQALRVILERIAKAEGI